MDENKLKQNISFREKLSYGLGDVGCNLISVHATTYIAYFYTEAMGLNAAIIGTIVMVSKLLDGLSDIIVGFLVDRTKSKYGKARSWILRTAVPISVCLILCFTVPEGAGMAAYVYVAVTYNLINTVFYTLMNLPYATLNSLMTRDQDQRMQINAFRMTLAQGASMVTNMLTIPLVGMMGGTSNRSAWIKLSCIYAAVAAVLFLICFFNTKERVTVQKTEGAQKSQLKSLAYAFRNKYWVILVAECILVIMFVALIGSSSAYYAKYILGNENMVGIITAMTFIPAFILVPCMPAAAKKIGKRNICLIGSMINLAGSVLMCLRPADLTWILISCFIRGCGYVMIMGTVYAMLADTVEYGEWKTGVRTEGVLYAANSFGTKIGGGIGAAIAMWVLGRAGYDGTAAVQSEAALMAIKADFLYIPLIVVILMPILFYFYKLDSIFPQVMSDLMKHENQKEN